MKSTLSVLLIILLIEPSPFQGKWQLTKFDAFPKTLESKFFLEATQEQQKVMLETIDFVYANTFYEFKGDSVYYSDAGGGDIIKNKNGKWLTKGDTLFIIESGKFKITKFWIENQTDKELELKNFIFTDSGVQKADGSMIFTKIQ